MKRHEKAKKTKQRSSRTPRATAPEAEREPRVLEEICIEELAIDGICGVY
jgi:mycofactocin precursor